MNSHSELPQSLVGPFRVDVARAAGVRPGRLREQDLARPFRGVRQREQPGDLVSLCRAFAQNLRHEEMFCGLTAAQLWNVPLAPHFRSDELHVAIPSPGRGRRAKGVVGHRVSRREGLLCRRFGLPVTDAASTWLSLTRVLPLNELIAAGDHLVHEPEYPDRREPRPYVTLDELHLRISLYTGRGKRLALAAVNLMSTRSESRPESLLRLLLRDGGLPRPEVNPIVHDERGERIGRADLVFRSARVIVEYDGQQHRTDSAQYDKDATRLEKFHLAGWHVLRVRKQGLFDDPEQTLARVRAVLTLPTPS